MTEVEYVIANFSERFAAFRDKRIVLHGSRNYAEAIIENFANRFNFIGIMSLDPIEDEYFHGLKVVSEEEFPVLNVDVVILTERVKYAVEAFRSIRRVCKSNKIAVYNMYGVDEFRVHYEAERAKTMTLAEAKKLCYTYDMIAFEVMDTVFYNPYFATDVSVRILFYDLIRFLRKQGKEIRFSLRKSFPADVQIKALKKYELLLDEEREVIYRYGEDLSFRRLRANNPNKKILYFGSGLANEFILPRCYGIDTCRFVGIQIFDCLEPYGQKQTIKRNYFSGLKQRIKDKILEKKVISFDIFDTLLIRKTLYPRDVFLLVEQKALLAGYDVNGFADARVRAEEDQPLCNIHQIYIWLGEHFEWNAETIRKIQALELETELEVLSPRTEIVALLKYALKAGKRIVLTSDMYLSESILRNILLKNGISGYEELLVSCDVKKTKHSGLYNMLIRLCGNPGQILHIGDHPVADGTDCERLGIESVLVPSVLEMACSRGWEKCLRNASNLMERCLLGLIISRIFRDPFQNPNLMELPIEVRRQRLGFGVIAPVIIGYLTWLIQKLNQQDFASVLFLARDGWLPYNIYCYVQERFLLPAPFYYYANRHSAFLCCADSEQEIDQILENGKLYNLDAEAVLRNVYQMPEKDLLPRSEGETASEYIGKHMNQINIIAKNAREGYLRFSEKCGMIPDRKYAVFDFIAIGNTQKYLSRFLPFHLKGFYFANYTSAASGSSETEYYFQDKGSKLLRGYVEKLEPFLTSLEPSQLCMTTEGNPVFAEEHRSDQELQEVKSVLESTEVLAKEFFELFYRQGESISSQFIEEIYVSEDYSLIHHTVYDDWHGVALGKIGGLKKEET